MNAFNCTNRYSKTEFFYTDEQMAIVLLFSLDFTVRIRYFNLFLDVVLVVIVL